jgi:hypothetical protein
MRRIRLPLLALLSVLALPAARATAPAGDPVAECSAHLRALHRALAAYERDHHRLPDQLSDLVPKYLADRKLLLCPVDPTAGEPGPIPAEMYGPFAHRESRLATSYYYEFSADKSRGIHPQLGPFPETDLPGESWGSWRHANNRQGTFYGDRVPVLRCFHHQSLDRDEDENVLNLTIGGQVYRSGIRWENHPGTVAEVLKRFAHDLDAGRRPFERKWYVGSFEQYFYGWDSDPRCTSSMRPQLLAVAERLQRLAQDQPPDQKPYTLRVAAQLLIAAGEYRRSLPVIEEARRLLARLPGKEWIEEGILRGEREAQILAKAYQGLGQHEKVITLFEPLVEKRTVGQNYYMRSIGDAYAALGQREKAEEWWLKADPARALVGKAAPGFTLPTLAGGPVGLQDALRGKKAVLMNFWFYH